MKTTSFKGATNHFMYDSFMAMHKRCYKTYDKSYKDYGARGITVCERWFDFGNYLMDMGERPDGMFLDRINNNGNYEPSNCRWANSRQQNNNKRSNRYVDLDGKKTLLSDVARELNMNYFVLYQRMKTKNFTGDAREHNC